MTRSEIIWPNYVMVRVVPLDLFASEKNQIVPCLVFVANPRTFLVGLTTIVDGLSRLSRPNDENAVN